MNKPPFYNEDTIDFEADKQQDLADLNMEYFIDDELDYPEYDDVSTAY